jgi:hypothetical protein
MKLQGGCYCGAVRYEAEGEPGMRAQCHCRECQYISGGSPNVILVMKDEGFRYTQGEVKGFTRPDLEKPVTREFCPECGTQLLTRPFGGRRVAIKVGTLDDPSVFTPDMAVYTTDKQPFRMIAEGLPAYERMPAALAAAHG